MTYSVSTYTYGPTSGSTGLTNAQIKAWATLFLASMTANGWVQTSDTGQLVPSTITANLVSTLTTLGYFVFKLNDSYSTTDPVYVKCLFQIRGIGQNGGTSEYWGPQIDNTVGFATDGAGTITGNLVTCGVGANGPGYGMSYKSALDIFAGGDGWATVFHGLGCAYSSSSFLVRQICALSVMRIRNASGVVQTGKVFISYAEPLKTYTTLGSYSPYNTTTSTTNAGSHRLLCAYLPKVGVVIKDLPVTPGVIGDLSASGSVGGVVQAQPTWMFYPQIAPKNDIIIVPATIFTTAQIFTASLDGVNQASYAHLGATNTSSTPAPTDVGAVYGIDNGSSFNSGANANYCYAVRIA